MWVVVIGRASNGYEAIDMFRQHQPDIVLMDLRMPEMSGVEATIVICAEFKQARIIILTTYDGDEDIYRGLRAGAKGYVLKDAEAQELLSAIRTVHAGRQYIPPAVGARLVERLSSPELSDRELEVLRLMATGKSNLEIIAMVRKLRTEQTAQMPSLGRLPDSPLPELPHGDSYSSALSIAEGTVKFHTKNILSKLRVGDRTQAMMVAL
jgi:two-component system, NarL family, response regulator